MKIEAKELSKVYGKGESQVTALDRVSLRIMQGDFLSITGPFGMGLYGSSLLCLKHGGELQMKNLPAAGRAPCSICCPGWMSRPAAV